MGTIIRAAALVATTLLVVGCGIGTMLPGTIYSQDGKVLSFQIEKAYRTGAVTALDPATGERFSGTYVGILERTTTLSSSFLSGQTNVAGTGFAGTATSTASGFGTGSVGSNIANATAYLAGDKGTVLTCEMLIEAGFSPHGIGKCSDNKGKNYRLQF